MTTYKVAAIGFSAQPPPHDPGSEFFKDPLIRFKEGTKSFVNNYFARKARRLPKFGFA